jgi:hypothetical protein
VTGNRRDASLVALLGATGSGKSSAIRAAVADAEPRLMVWDYKREYRRLGHVCETRQAFYDRAVAAWRGSFRLVFCPSFDVEAGRREFDWFCQLAYWLGDVLLVADELHRVMTASWSPMGWNLAVTLGRARGVRIIAASQRPAEIAKDFWDAATVVRTGRLNGEASARAVAGVLLVHWREVVALPPLHWIQRSIYRPAIIRGRVVWRGGAPADEFISESPLPVL